MTHKLTLLLIAFTFSLAGCNGKTEAAIDNTSADGQVKIHITGSRNNSLDAFKTIITVTAYNFKEGRLQFEIMAPDLNNKNVKFDWKDGQNCLITIEEQDKHIRSFQLIASPNQVQLAEI